MSPTNSNANDAQILARDGEALRLQKRYDAAQIKFKEAIRINPKYAWPHAHLGETYRQWNFPDNFYLEAIKAFEKAIELEPNYAWAYAHLGETHRALQQYDKAEKSFKKAIDIDKKYAWAIAHLGANSYDMGKYDEAIKYLEEAIGYGTIYPWAKVYLATAQLQKKEDNKALLNLLDAIVQDPFIIKSAAKDRGMLYLYKLNYENALVFFQQALQENPNDIETNYYSATVITHLKGSDEAQPFINKVRGSLKSGLGNTLEELNEDYIMGGLASLEGDLNKAKDYLVKALPARKQLLIKANADPAYLGILEKERLFQQLLNFKTTEN
jgi:tetratricopeptide (TPR) repeat protein